MQEHSLPLPFTSAQNYQEALRYIGKLPFEQAESNMKRYGKILMHHIPEQTTQLLKGLCTDYQPSLEGRGDREAPGCRVRPQGEWLLDKGIISGASRVPRPFTRPPPSPLPIPGQLGGVHPHLR